MKPEWHIEYEKEGCYRAGIREAIENKKYIRASISKEDIGRLLQGYHITLAFLNDGYEQEGMIDIGLSGGKTEFEVSEELNGLIINKKFK